MVSVLVILLIAMLASLCVWQEDGKFSWQRTLTMFGISTVVMTFVLWAVFYLFCPALTGILFGVYRVAALPILAVSAVMFLHEISFNYGRNELDVTLQMAKIGSVILLGAYVFGAPALLHNDDLYNLPQVVLQNNSSDGSHFPPIDINHVRQVDQAMAFSIGNKEIGNSTLSLGSQYHLNKEDLAIQYINGEPKWVAPLQYNDVMKWFYCHTSPGYIVVDAEDPQATAELHIGYEMKYTTSAYLWDDLERHLYRNGYDQVTLSDCNFELMDNYTPRWVVSVTYPTVVNSGEVVKGVVVVDPETGDFTEYPLDKVPAWIDRVVPEAVMTDYLKWYGLYPHGFWNTLLSNKDVNTPTTIDGNVELWLVHASDNNPYWFAGMTSPGVSDTALTYLVLGSTRDGKIYLYRTSGWNEQAVINNVNSAVLSDATNFQGSQPIPYECVGRLTYIVPVSKSVGEEHYFQEVAMVDATNGHVELGDTKEEAYANYRKYLSASGFNGDLASSSVSEKLSGVVGRISGMASASGGDYRLMQLNDSQAIFEIGVTEFPEVALTDSGDRVSITYAETGAQVVEVSQFDNLAIDSRGKIVKQKERAA